MADEDFIDGLFGKDIAINGTKQPIRRGTINFVADGATAVDNPKEKRTDVTLPGTGGGDPLPGVQYLSINSVAATETGAIGAPWKTLPAAIATGYPILVDAGSYDEEIGREIAGEADFRAVTLGGSAGVDRVKPDFPSLDMTNGGEGNFDHYFEGLDLKPLTANPAAIHILTLRGCGFDTVSGFSGVKVIDTSGVSGASIDACVQVAIDGQLVQPRLASPVTVTDVINFFGKDCAIDLDYADVAQVSGWFTNCYIAGLLRDGGATPEVFYDDDPQIFVCDEQTRRISFGPERQTLLYEIESPTTYDDHNWGEFLQDNAGPIAGLMVPYLTMVAGDIDTGSNAITFGGFMAPKARLFFLSHFEITNRMAVAHTVQHLDGGQAAVNMVRSLTGADLSLPPKATLILDYDYEAEEWLASVRSDGGSTSYGIGVFSSRPAAGTAGKPFVSTDGPVKFIDNGAAWQPEIAGTLGTEVPDDVATTFPDVIGSGATVVNFKGAIFCDMASAAGDALYARVASYSAPITRTMHVRALSNGVTEGGVYKAGGQGGIVIAGAGTDYTSFTYGTVSYDGGPPATIMVAIDILDWTNATTISGTVLECVVSPGPLGMWLQYEDDNSEQIFRMSTDGFHWIELARRDRDAGYSPTRVGVGVARISGGTFPVQALIDSYSLVATP